MSDIANKLNKATTVEQQKKLYDTLTKKYGDYDGDEYYYGARSINRAKEWLDTNDSLIIERSLGRAVNVKNDIIKELQKRGYNAMYDNASIGVGSDGRYSKVQEGVEPLIIFDSETTLKEVNTRRVDRAEQVESKEQYEQWKQDRNKTLEGFK